jgi:Flp pilus assembly pilin Flp
MKMFQILKTFRNDEDGAVTVDWVVLTAAVVGLGIAVLASVRTGASDISGDVRDTMTNYTISTAFTTS